MLPPELGTSKKAIWQLTWPQMLMMYLVFFTGFITVWVAGQISSDVQAAMGMVAQCSLFMMVVIMAISSGATASVSQSLGAGKIRRAQLYIATTVIGSFILGLFVAVPGWIFGENILNLIQTPETILPISNRIWKVAILTLPLQYAYSATGVMFRATRLVLPPLWVSAIVCIVSLVLSLGLGLGWFHMPQYGYMGLMWANMGAVGLGAALNCLLLARSGYLRIKILPSLRWLGEGLPYLLRVALPAGAASIVWQSGYLTLFVLVASLPQDSVNALAGLTAGLRAEALLFMPGMALHMTTSVLVGNSLGAGKPEQAKYLGLKMVFLGSASLGICALILWPFRQEIAEFLSGNPKTVEQIFIYLSYNFVATPFSIASQIMGGIMVGAGATQYNLMVYGGTFWAVRIPLGWFLGHRLWGTASGVFAAMLISQILQTAVMLCVICRCNWQRFAMRRNKIKNRGTNLQ